MLNRVSREWKNTRSEDGNSFKAKFKVQDKKRLKMRFSDQVPSNTPKFNKGKGLTFKPQRGKVSGPYVEKSTCTK